MSCCNNHLKSILTNLFTGIKSLKSCLEEAGSLLELQPIFLKNTAYISQFIKNTRSQFRSFPILQYLRKIKLSIEKIQKNNAQATASTIRSVFPLYLGSGLGLELPTKEYFDYFLAKILAHCKIMVRLVICSKKCALYFIHFLQYGHYMEISTMVISLLGHIWHQARQCLLAMDSFYSRLYTHRDLFPVQKAGGKEYDIPRELGSFIGEDWKEQIDVLVEQNATSSTGVFKLVDLTGADDKGEATSGHKRSHAGLDKTTNKKPKIEEATDCGEVVSRESLTPLKSASHVAQVFGKNSLVKFLKNETEYRTTKSEKSLTKSISQFHWEKFRQLMENNLKSKKGDHLRDLFNVEWAKLMK